MIDAALVSGWLAIALLVAALAATPLARVASRLATARRPLGIAAALAACAHAALVVSTELGGARAWGAVVAIPSVRSGALALALLLPLLATSFPRATRALGVRLWKPLHRLAYAAALLAVHHVMLAPFAPRAAAMVLAAVLAGLAVARGSPHRRSPSVPAEDTPTPDTTSRS